jgi:hypothetical protein
MTHAKAIAALTALVLAGPAPAAVLYDEGILGDAAPGGLQGSADQVSTLNSAGLGDLGAGNHSVSGTVQGGSVDNVDIFSFTALGSFTIDLDSYDAGTGNESTAFWLTDGGKSWIWPVTASAFLGNPGANIFGGFAPGSYFFSVQETNSATPTSYWATINVAESGGPAPRVTPLPGAVLLLGGALAALGTLSRRR